MIDNNDTFLGNIEAEEAILGGILLDPRAMSEVADILQMEAFCLEAHQIIYQAALTLYQKDKPTDLVAVSNYLADQKLIDKVGYFRTFESSVLKKVQKRTRS